MKRICQCGISALLVLALIPFFTLRSNAAGFFPGQVWHQSSGFLAPSSFVQSAPLSNDPVNSGPTPPTTTTSVFVNANTIRTSVNVYVPSPLASYRDGNPTASFRGARLRVVVVSYALIGFGPGMQSGFVYSFPSFPLPSLQTGHTGTPDMPFQHRIETSSVDIQPTLIHNNVVLLQGSLVNLPINIVGPNRSLNFTLTNFNPNTRFPSGSAMFLRFRTTIYVSLLGFGANTILREGDLVSSFALQLVVPRPSFVSSNGPPILVSTDESGIADAINPPGQTIPTSPPEDRPDIDIDVGDFAPPDLDFMGDMDLSDFWSAFRSTSFSTIFFGLFFLSVTMGIVGFTLRRKVR